MSLTSILKDTEQKELKERFKVNFPNPGLKFKAEIKAPPISTNYGIVGTAFDYLMRFFLQKHNKDRYVDSGYWVADHAYTTISNGLRNSKEQHVRTGFYGDKIFNRKKYLKTIENQYLLSKFNYEHFISSGVFSDSLVESSLFLAKLDLYYRTGIIDHTLDDHSKQDIEDLKAILSLLEHSKFVAKEKIYFNPTFGIGSMLVGGADGDIIIDDTLIDIKTSKHLELSRQDLNQIIGYYVLSLIGGVFEKKVEIKNIGIYFARYGVLWTYPVASLGDSKKINAFKEWFCLHMTDGKYNVAGFKKFIKEMDKKIETDHQRALKEIEKEKEVLKKQGKQHNKVSRGPKTNKRNSKAKTYKTG